MTGVRVRSAVDRSILGLSPRLPEVAIGFSGAGSGACRPNAEVKLCLACGRIATDTDRAGLHRHFAEKGWELWDEPSLHERLKQMSDRGYENQVSAVVATAFI
jgi:hypothetical protein